MTGMIRTHPAMPKNRKQLNDHIMFLIKGTPLEPILKGEPPMAYDNNHYLEAAKACSAPARERNTILTGVGHNVMHLPLLGEDAIGEGTGGAIPGTGGISLTPEQAKNIFAEAYAAEKLKQYMPNRNRLPEPRLTDWIPGPQAIQTSNAYKAILTHDDYAERRYNTRVLAMEHAMKLASHPTRYESANSVVAIAQAFENYLNGEVDKPEAR